MAGVSTFVQPDFTSQTATVYKTSIDDAVAVHHQVAGPFAPHEKSVPDLQVLIDAADFSVMATRVTVSIAQQTTAAFTAPTTNPRNDIISADLLTGVISVTTGAESASPVDPVFTADEFPIARIRLTVGMSEITNADIDDIRVLGALGLGTSALLDTGTAAGELPTNADLGTASLIDTGAASGEIGLNAEAFVDRTAAATTNIGANTSLNVRIIGTTTITAFDNVASGLRRKIRFADALTLTHNGTSLILPGSANITTAADDTAEFISLGSGNWLCLNYKRADGTPVVAPTPTFANAFESSPITLAINTVHSAAHGLGAIPKLIQAVLRCTTAEHGYSIDDEVLVSSYYETSSIGTTVAADATTIYMIYTASLRVFNKSTAAAAGITTANWDVVLKGWL